MQDDIMALFAYDRWANRKVLDACRKLTAEQYVAEPVPGWSSVRSTIYHIALATEFNLRALAVAPDEHRCLPGLLERRVLGVRIRRPHRLEHRRPLPLGVSRHLQLLYVEQGAAPREQDERVVGRRPQRRSEVTGRLRNVGRDAERRALAVPARSALAGLGSLRRHAPSLAHQMMRM